MKRLWANLPELDDLWVRKRAAALGIREAEVIRELVHHARTNNLSLEGSDAPTLTGFAQWLKKQRDIYKLDAVGPDRKVKPGGVSLYGLIDAYLKDTR